jgi:hypothetical protein
MDAACDLTIQFPVHLPLSVSPPAPKIKARFSDVAPGSFPARGLKLRHTRRRCSRPKGNRLPSWDHLGPVGAMNVKFSGGIFNGKIVSGGGDKAAVLGDAAIGNLDGGNDRNLRLSTHVALYRFAFERIVVNRSKPQKPLRKDNSLIERKSVLT